MTRDRDDLEPIEPHSARELFLEHKATECADATVQSYGYRLEHLVDWCEEEGIDNLNDLTGRDIQRYRIWRKNSGDLNKMTMNAQMSTLRVFLKWAASIEAVEPNLYDKVMVPRVKVHERKRDEKLEPDTAQEILDYLTRYHYALPC